MDYYELHLNTQHWTCGEGCCHEWWYEPKIFKVDPYGNLETLMDTGEEWNCFYSKDEEIILEEINSYHNLDIVLDSHNCKIVF